MLVISYNFKINGIKKIRCRNTQQLVINDILSANDNYEVLGVNSNVNFK